MRVLRTARRAARLLGAGALAWASVSPTAARAQRPNARTTRLDSTVYRVAAPDTAGPAVIERGDTLFMVQSAETVARFAKQGVPVQRLDTLRALFAPDTVVMLVRDKPGAPLRREPADPVMAHMFRVTRDATRSMRAADAALEQLRRATGAP